MSSFKYSLSKSPKKLICPNPSCQKKTFVPYVYNDDLKEVDTNLYGRCDRENNCGYHHHPETDSEFVPDHEVSEVQQPEYEQIFAPAEKVNPIINRTHQGTSPLHKWCASKLLIPVEHLIEFGVYTDGEKTAFLYKDRNGNVTNIKWFKYKENGHRDKSFNSFSLSQPKNPPSTPAKNTEAQKIKKFFLSLFGEHLLDPKKERIVCVVESEKSAAIAKFFYPQFDWVGCGSANGLSDGSNGTSNKIAPLMNRLVYWLADADKAGRDNSSIRNLNKYEIKHFVIDLFPERNDGYDIGDAIEDGLRPEINPLAQKLVEFLNEGKEDEDSEAHIEELNPRERDSYMYDLPEGVDWDVVKWDIKKYGHFVHMGKIYVIRAYKGKDASGYYSQHITNFTTEPLGLILSKHSPRRLISVKNMHNFENVLEVPTKAFASNTEFTVFVESIGNFQWNGSVTDLKKVRAKLYDNMPSYEEVQSLGWHPDGFWICANGIYDNKFHPIDDFGFVKHRKKNFYIEPLSCINQNNDSDWEDEKKFIFRKREDVDLLKWSSLFCKVHKENGKIALAWFITSLFRDHVYKIFKFFPHLFLFGPPGTGKSQVGWSVRSLGFIGIKKPFNLSGGTKVSFHREFTHFTNFPCWFDEYDNSIDYDRVQSLKAAYDGAGHKKSVQDSDIRTKTVPVNSACMISGQQLPIADNALFKRVILTQFHQAEYSAEEKKLFSDLQAIEEDGLTHITAGFMHFRKLVEKKFLSTFDEVLKDMIDGLDKNTPVEDRIMRNMAICVAMYKLIASKIGDKLPFTFEELKPIALNFVKEQMALILNANETNAFWDMVEFLLDKRLIADGDDFKIEVKETLKIKVGGEEVERRLDRPTEVLFLRTSQVIPLYKENFKKQNSATSSPMDKGSLIHYLQHSKPFLGLVPKTNFDRAKRTSAYAFDYDLLKAQGINLERGEEEVPAEGKPVDSLDLQLTI